MQLSSRETKAALKESESNCSLLNYARNKLEIITTNRNQVVWRREGEMEGETLLVKLNKYSKRREGL